MQVDIEASEKSQLKNDSDLKFLSQNPAQIATWIDDNVTNLADVKFVLKKLLKISVYVLKNDGIL